MKLVKDLMTRSIQTIAPDVSLTDAAASLLGSGIRALPVVDGDRLVGIITDRDITIRATSRGLDPREAKVRDAMTEGVIRCFQDQPVANATTLMAKHRIHRVVVLSRADDLVEVISLEDVAADSANAELVREVLERIEQRPHLGSPPFAHILVALDGSELAEQALPYAEALAGRFGSKVTLLRAVTDSLLLPESAEPSSSRSARLEAPISDRTRFFPADYLNAIKGRLESMDIVVELDHPEIRAADAIVRGASDLGIAPIAMTTHGRGVWGGSCMEAWQATCFDVRPALCSWCAPQVHGTRQHASGYELTPVLCGQGHSSSVVSSPSASILHLDRNQQGSPRQR